MPGRVFPLVFLIVFAAHSQRPSHSLTFGGSGNDSINAVAADASGNIYVTGTTASFDFPLRNPFQAANRGTEIIYSADAGATWTPLGNPLPVTTPLSTPLLAVDPTNSQIVYAASATSICKSTNGGLKFTCVALNFASFQTALTSLIVDPQQPSTLYASATTNGGVFKSADAGQTWTNASAGLPSQGFIDSIVADPFHAGVLYAWAGGGGYVSTNGATSWSLSTLPWPKGTSVSGPSGPGFSFDPVTPGIIYGPNYLNNQFGVQKSADGGVTWTALNTPFSSCCVVPDPKVSGTIYTTASANNGPVFFWKSTDGGATWTSTELPPGASGPLVIDPANPLIMLSGAFRTIDGGQTWQPTNASRSIQPVFAASSNGVVYAAAPITSDAFLAKFLPDGQTLVFSTYLGGMGNDVGQSIALDAAGNIWIAGSTSSHDLPVTQGAFQGALKGTTNAFLAKFSSAGSLLAASYLGGSNTDTGLGIAIGPQGNPWLAANSNSPDFPQTAVGISTTFAPVGYAIELDSSAAHLMYSASSGGTFDSNGKGIAIDSAGNVTVTGSVYTAFPITTGAFHNGSPATYSPKAFVLKLSPSGQVIYSTYFGGSQAAPTPIGFLTGPENEHDYGIAVAVDAAGNAYVAGYTSAADFPTTPGAFQTSLAAGCPYPAFSDDTGLIGTISYYYVDDVFLIKLSPDGKTAIASTLLGGSCYDHPTSLALNQSGDVYVAGETDSINFPVASPVQGAPPTGDYVSFVSVFNPALSALTFSSYVYAGATPSVIPASGKSIYVAGATGAGAQSNPYSSFVTLLPTIATDGYLVMLEPPHPAH